MRCALRVVVLILGIAVVISGCGKGGGSSGTTFTAQNVSVEAGPAFGDVLDAGPATLPDGRAVSFACYSLGQLSLPSGKIVAADGFILFGQKPFTRSVKPGDYPVTVAVAQFGDDARIAFAQVRFSDRRVVKWETALTPGQDLSKLKPDEIYCYGVDSGTGCFADPGAQEVLSGGNAKELLDEAEEAMKKVYKPTRDWVVINTPKGSAALFSSGWGDGGYASYFGLDDHGEPVTLVTDFQVVDWKRRAK